MTTRWMTVIPALALALTMTACGEEKETTLTGMITAVDGTVISVVEMSANMQGERPSMPESGEMPSMPEGMEDFTIPEDFDPEKPDRTPPEGFDPGNFGGQMPNGGDMPERPTGEGMPEMPNGQGMPNFGDISGMFGGMGEARSIDIANARISVEIEEGKASGSMEDIKPGTFVTITLHGKGEATAVLVAASSGFGGRFMPNF